MTKTIWEDLMENKYPITRTPKELTKKLESGEKEGTFLNNGFRIDFRIIREDSSAWVVESETVSPSGGVSGGNYYVNKKNPTKAVWD